MTKRRWVTIESKEEAENTNWEEIEKVLDVLMEHHQKKIKNKRNEGREGFKCKVGHI